MTDQQHPITPPLELVQQWLGEFFGCVVNGEISDSEHYITTQAARWGADQELEACCEWLEDFQCSKRFTAELRAARRPKPPILKEQALSALYAIATGADDTREFHQDIETIKTALEQLDD